MSKLLCNCIKLCFIILHCTAKLLGHSYSDEEKLMKMWNESEDLTPDEGGHSHSEEETLMKMWDKSDFRTSDEGEKILKMKFPKKTEYHNIFHTEKVIGNKGKHDTMKLRNLKQTLKSKQFTLEEIAKFKLWPRATIPFYIDQMSFDKVLREQIRDHLDYANQLTELNFEELPNPPQDENERWVLFLNRRGQLDCKDYSTNSFTNSGVQKVIVGYDCLRTRGPMAAIVLALAGVPPQHNSPDRDQFIKVSMESIVPEKRGLFKVLSRDEWMFDMSYDAFSVGHYHSYKYTANGSATILALPQVFSKKKMTNFNMRSLYPIEENNNYSYMDIGKLIVLYKNINDRLKIIKKVCPQKGYKDQHRGEMLSDLEYERR